MNRCVGCKQPHRHEGVCEVCRKKDNTRFNRVLLNTMFGLVLVFVLVGLIVSG